jgi:hypothetical protein
MIWVGPNLMIGTSNDAITLDFTFFEGDDNLGVAAQQIRIGSGVVVASRYAAVGIMNFLDAPSEWVHRQVDTQWAIEVPSDDDEPDSAGPPSTKS